MYHYVYRLDHLETGEFYIGSRSSKVHHSLDSYMGSMSVWRPDKTKLKKIILKDDFVNRDDAMQFEAYIIKQFINDNLNRNYYIPGNGFHTVGQVTVIDKDGNTFKCSQNDPRFLSGELVGATKGRFAVKDNNGNNYSVLKNDIRFLTGKVVGCSKGLVSVKDNMGNNFKVSKDDPRYISGELVSHFKNMIMVKDELNNKFLVSKDDERYISGKLVGISKGSHHTPETIDKIKESKKKNPQTGSKNSQYGTICINDGHVNKIIKKDHIDELDYFYSMGWIKGRISKPRKNNESILY